MPTKTELIQNLDSLTQRISDKVWAVSVGVLATCLTFIVESTKADGVPFLDPAQVAIPAGIALLALAADLTQYAAANRQCLVLLRKMEAEGLQEARFEKGFLMWLRGAAYRAKFWLCVTSVAWIVWLTARRVLELLEGAG